MPDSFITPGEVLNANGQSAVCGVSGYGGVAFQIQGTFDATLTFQASLGSEWVDMRVTASDSSTPTSTTTDPGVYIGSVVGFTSVRVVMSDRNSGAAYVLIRADVASPGGAGGGGGAGDNVNLIEVGGSSIALGEAAMAASLPVVIASDQTPIPITGSITAENNAAGPVGDPIPADASSTAFEGPTGDLETFKLESFDYDTGGGTDPTTAIGLKIPGSGGGVAVGSSNPLPVSAAALPLPSGAATLAEQQTQTTALGTLLTTTAFNAAFGTAGSADAQVLSVQGIAAMTPLLVDGSGSTQPISGSVTVSGSVTANAGTNLNTSALALESGGNLAAIAASASVLDDWDESDRAKVNLIVGQAGIAAGTGTDGATVPRVTLATNVGLPAGSAIIGAVKRAGPNGTLWDVQHAPSENTLATVTQASAGGGVKNVCTGFTVTLAATSSAPAAIQLYVMVVDGATTGTTYLWRTAISLPAVAGAITSFVRSGLWLVGTADTAMTIEFSAAGGANTVESVTMEGTTSA